jgi:hypothetical protein
MVICLEKIKKIFIILLFLSCYLDTFAQDTTECKKYKYISAGISLTNGNNFLIDAYNSVEFGGVYKNIGIGMVLGRGTLKGMLRTGDSLNKYFYEIKTCPSISISVLSFNMILGYGGYFNTKNNFIEYGFGSSITQGDFSYGVSYSNWDGVNYISPSITFNF